MATVSFQLRAAFVTTYGGGTIFVDNNRSYDVKAGLTAGSGTITVDAADSPLVYALDHYPPLFRSGSSPTDPPAPYTKIETIQVRRPEPPTAGQVPIIGADGIWTAGTVSGGGGSDPNALLKTLVDAKGDLLAASANDAVSRLPVGANGEILTADSTQTLGVRWSASPGGGILATIVDAKGDLLVGSANDTVARLGIGTNGQVLTADSTQTLGAKWAAIPGSPWIDAVSAFGADNTGSTGTRAALQSALDSAPAQGATVFCRAGTYLIDGTLQIPDKVRLVGAGRYATQLYQISGTGPVIQQKTTGSRDIFIEHLAVVGLGNVTNGGGVDLTGCTDSHVNWCTIGYCNVFGIRIKGGPTQGDAMHCRILGNFFNGMAYNSGATTTPCLWLDIPAGSNQSHPDGTMIAFNNFQASPIGMHSTTPTVSDSSSLLNDACTFIANETIEVLKPITGAYTSLRVTDNRFECTSTSMTFDYTAGTAFAKAYDVVHRGNSYSTFGDPSSLHFNDATWDGVARLNDFGAANIKWNIASSQISGRALRIASDQIPPATAGMFHLYADDSDTGGKVALKARLGATGSVLTVATETSGLTAGGGALLPATPAPTLAALGDSITKASDSSAATNPLWFDGDIRNPLWWAHVLSKAKLQIVQGGIAATAGYTSTQIRTTHLPTVLALNPRPGFCAILAGTNDTSEATTKTETITICDALVAVGIWPVLCTLVPEDTANANANWERVNRWLRHYARIKGYPLVDYFALLGSSASGSTGGWAVAGDTSDGIHPTAQGAKKMGQLLADSLTAFHHPNAPAVAYYQNSADNLLGNNAMMLNNASGTPTNWSNNAAAGATFSVASDSNIKGNYATVLRGSADAYIQSGYMTFTVGHRYAMGYALKSTVEASGGNAGIFLWNLSGSYTLAGFNDCRRDIPSGSLMSMEFDWPSGLDSNQAALFARARGASGASVSIGQTHIYDLTALGLV